MKNRGSLLFVAGMTAALLASAAPADVIFQYEGAFFTDVFPSIGSVDLTTADRITGTITFEDTSAIQAKSIQLTTTVGGNPGFTIDIPDAMAPGAFDVEVNEFTFAGDSLVDWDLTVRGEAFGTTDGIEELSISGLLGDLATIDFLAGTQADAFNMVPGQSNAVTVPEPSSVLLITAVFMGTLTIRRMRRRSMTGESRG